MKIINAGNINATMQIVMQYAKKGSTTVWAKTNHGSHFELWRKLRQTIKYTPDPEGKELIRSVEETLKGKKADCEDFAIMISAIMLHKNIGHSFRIYDYGRGWEHIVLVLADGTVIDPVNDVFNVEPEYVKVKDYYHNKNMKKETWRVRRNNGLGRIGVDAVEARKNGFYYATGNKYERPYPIKNKIVGKNTKVSFALDVVVDAEYAIIPAEQLQPSHLGAIENPYHFIPEAQPRNRATSESGATVPIRIAENLRPSEMCEGSTAYGGCPVVNERGEVIQGSGRAYAMIYYWRNFPNDPKKYAEYLKENLSNFGFESFVNIKKDKQLLSDKIEVVAYIGGGNDKRIKDLSQLKTINNPVLVRIVKCSDAEAIKLGQYKQSDLEALSSKTNETKSRVNRIDESKLSRLLDNVFAQSQPDDSLSDIIRKTNLLTQLIKLGAIRPDEIENFYRNGEINKDGVLVVSDILLNLIFKGSDTNIPEIFSQLPFRIQNAIIKATPFLLRVPEDKNIRKEVSNAILATRDYLNTDYSKVKAWSNTISMFGGSIKDQFSAVEIALVEIFTTAKTQTEIVSYFDKYNRLVADTEADLINPATKGMSKKEAINTVFLGITTNKDSEPAPDQNKAFIMARAKAKLKLLALNF
jgi:hypothetical protein